jgi:hypothetical protein
VLVPSETGTCDVTRARGAPGAAADAADAPWQAYLPLWRALLCGEGLPGDEAAALLARRDAWAPALYDALMRAVCDAVENLELGYAVAPQEDQAEGDAAAGLPARPMSPGWAGLRGPRRHA